jgi:DNA repair protein RadC
MSERLQQSDFFANIEETVKSSEPPEHAQLREAVSKYINLEELRDPQTDIRSALRYDSDQLPEEIKRMVGILEILLTPESREQIKSPTDLARVLMLTQGFLQQEQLGAAYLDTKNRLQKLHMIYQGSLNTTMIRVGEVFREAVRLNSAALIIYHGHPSADPTPSPEDVLVTREIVMAGKLLDVDVLDHLVLGQGRWVSMRERGLGFSSS